MKTTFVAATLALLALNGCALASGGKGLVTQMRRAQAIGAEVTWASDTAGSRFNLRLPLTRNTARLDDGAVVQGRAQDRAPENPGYSVRGAAGSPTTTAPSPS